jgi:hypothetical protein
MEKMRYFQKNSKFEERNPKKFKSIKSLKFAQFNISQRATEEEVPPIR